MKKVLVSVSIILLVPGCDLLLGTPVEERPEPAVIEETPAATDLLVPAGATTAEQFDTTTVAQREEVANAAPVSGGEVELGTTIASLGNPAVAGFWMETPLVSKVTDGRVVYAGTGRDVLVKLRPIEGPDSSGSRISLPTMRILGAPLTGLPELVVFAR